MEKVVEEIPAGAKRGVKRVIELPVALEEPEELVTPGTMHAGSSPDDACDIRIVTRYFLKSA